MSSLNLREFQFPYLILRSPPSPGFSCGLVHSPKLYGDCTFLKQINTESLDPAFSGPLSVHRALNLAVLSAFGLWSDSMFRSFDVGLTVIIIILQPCSPWVASNQHKLLGKDLADDDNDDDDDMQCPTLKQKLMRINYIQSIITLLKLLLTGKLTSNQVSDGILRKLPGKTGRELYQEFRYNHISKLIGCFM